MFFDSFRFKATHEDPYKAIETLPISRPIHQGLIYNHWESRWDYKISLKHYSSKQGS
jgi:hypothetical protein